MEDVEKANEHESEHKDDDIKIHFINMLLENYGKHSNAKQYSDEILEICFAFYTICRNSYLAFRNAFDLPCETTLKNHFSDIIKYEKENITSIDNIPKIIFDYCESNNITESFDAILGIDACSFDRLNIDQKKYAFCFYIQPINPQYSCFPIHLLPTNDGKASQIILDLSFEIITTLNGLGIDIIYISTDGDSGYRTPNEKTFDIYMLDAFIGGFDAALQAWNCNNDVKFINDMLHCLKAARTRLLNGNITLNCLNVDYTFNSMTLESVLHLGKTLTDDSPVGKMKDYYVLNLYNFKNLEVLLKNDLLH